MLRNESSQELPIVSGISYKEFKWSTKSAYLLIKGTEVHVNVTLLTWVNSNMQIIGM